jgi:hypothetical protein
VQGDRLEPDEVRARRHGHRDRGRPGRVLRNHLAGGPAASVDRAGKKTGVINLEPLEAVRVDASARRPRALGQVGEPATLFNHR